MPAGRSPVSSDGRADFDFLAGRWDVWNEKVEDPSPDGPPVWHEFASTAVSQPILGGLGNFDEYEIPDLPRVGRYHGLALRLFDPSLDLWRIWWASNPGNGDVDPPVAGRFADGRGEFEGDDDLDGRPIKVRYEWSDVTPRSARWEQSFSFDGGATFVPNWIMVFSRAGEGGGS